MMTHRRLQSELMDRVKLMLNTNKDTFNNKTVNMTKSKFLK